jgi:hypothetical protein
MHSQAHMLNDFALQIHQKQIPACVEQGSEPLHTSFGNVRDTIKHVLTVAFNPTCAHSL